MFDKASLIALIVFVAANFAAATSGAVFKPGAWYQDLNKPSWTPPNWAFPVVWTALFLMNAIAGWLVWEAAPENKDFIFTVYGVSLAINAGWSALFFGARRMDIALIDVAALWVSLAVLAALFAPVSAIAALLLVPYLCWVSLAAVLNFRMTQLNPRAPKTA